MGDEISDLSEGIYRAVIIDANGCILESLEYLLSPTGISELTPSIYSIYPNPAKAEFTIEVENLNGKLEIKVISVTGQDVSQMVNFEMNGEAIRGYNRGLLSGLYYLEIGEVGQTSL